MSDHIRVRSISLWSIRGLYIRKGGRTWRVERVSYVWSSVQGSRRLALKIDGLNIHIAKEEEGQTSAQSQRRRNRNLTLADLNPSPLAWYLWQFTSALTTFLEPCLRPIIRTYVVACLRIGIQWLPRITQALSFDLQSTVITLAEMPGTKIAAHEISLHTSLALTQMEQTGGPEDVKPTPNRSHNRKSLSVGLWKKRLAESFHRSLDKAWGEMRGTATLSLTLGNIIGTMPTLSLQESQNVPFLLLPGSIELQVSAKFNPKEGVVDPHGLEVSLKIGDCSVKVDLLKLLLEKLPKRPKTSPAINPPELLSPVSIQNGTPLVPSFSPGSQLSAAFPSPVQSFTSAIFSPSSLLFSPSSILSSSTLKSPSLLSPNSPQPFSPSSPFFRALSASIRPRRRYLVQPCVKLKDVKNVSQLSILHSIRVNVASIGLSVLSEAETGPYKVLMKDVAIDFSLSDPDQNGMHSKYLGCRAKSDTYDSDAYSLKLTLHQITVEREAQHHTMRLARLGSFNFVGLASQWPSPFLIPGPFMRDANAPILIVHARVAEVQITERIQDLQRLITIIGAPKEIRDKSHTPSTSLSIPRLIIGLESGPIGARIIYDAEGEKYRALELRNNGFAVSLDSEYKHPSLAIARNFAWANFVQVLHWNCTLFIVLEPVLVRVRLNQQIVAVKGATLLTSDKDFLDDPPVLSVGIIEVSVTTNAVAHTDGAAESLPVIDKSTLVYNMSTVFDTICTELWHPISVDATLRLLSIFHKTKMPEAKLEAQPQFTRLPAGLSAKIAIAHFVVCITSPVISPGENLDLSRGFSIGTTISLEYCSLHISHCHWFDDPVQTQSRAKLLLPAEPLVDALVAAKTIASPNETSAFVKVRVVNLIFKTAVATPYELDEPAIVGRDDLTENHQEFLRIHHMGFDLCLSCKVLSPHETPSDICDISVQVPSIFADLELAHVYSVLLGLQTIHILSPRPPRPVYPVAESKSNMLFMLQGNITTIRVHLALPHQQLVARIDGLSPRLDSSGRPPRITMAKTAVFVHLAPQTNRWEEPTGSRWEEFINLQVWEICLAPHDGSLSISINGDSARLRIPYGFILADFVQDAVVSLKAVRHISRITSAGCYSAMPSPEPEGPKSVPHITLRLDCLCLEAQDDPFESKLALIWQAGAEAVKQRLDREDAFKAKVATILTAASDLQTTVPKAEGEHEYQFSTKYTISIEDARKRLDGVHAIDWTLRLERLQEQRSKEEDAIMHKTHSPAPISSKSPDLAPMPSPQAPTLLRATLHNLSLTISPPSFSIDRLPDVMHDFGSGLPRDTKFSLLVPLHIHFNLSSLQVSLRDYPLPLFSVPPCGNPREVSWTFNTDLIIGEEMGSQLSVNWIDCPIIHPRQALHGEAPFSIAVPKTIMPVKTYAAPTIEVMTARPTILSWAVSYGSAIQDVMRVVDTLSSSPRDSSPALGFWDKMRLLLHWTVKVSFIGDVRLYMKGTRNPYNTLDSGAGFVLCWQGNPEILVGYENPQKELIQVISEGMLIAIPNLEHFAAKSCLTSEPIASRQKKPFQKVCARLSSGVRYGVGFVLERSCGPECLHCDGTPFHRKCRYFSFRPHYNVVLEKKLSVPDIKGPLDSYNGFRSDFIHLSVSLTSSTKIKELKGSAKPSSLHLTPRLFAHFWSWCSLFDGTLSLPIRQGSYHPPRPISPKLGRHLATLKYRISLRNLYVMHGYMDNSRETWVDGVTPWIGVKGKVEEFQADMHQREEESTAAGPIPNTTRLIRRKPFYAAELVMKGIELRAMLATFSEPLKQDVQITASPQKSNYRKHADLPITASTSTWYDLEDFVELGWVPSNPPVLHLLPLATFPHFTYFKRNSSLPGVFPQTSKFGSEHSHICLLGKEPSVPQIQISLASARATEINNSLQSDPTPRGRKGITPSSRSSMKKMLALLEEYISALRETEVRPQMEEVQTYHMPTGIVSPDEWAEFDNVYQIHCPSVFMDSAVRDIMMQYYYCSRDRRGFEYHMANRAVKFIRDQANAALAVQKEEERVKDRGPGHTAQMAAIALRKTYAILKGDTSTKISVDLTPERNSEVPGKIDPLDGWAEGVSLRKSNCCLLLKPQIVFRGESSADSCIVAAAQAKLQSFAIMDDSNLEDPVSGKVMSRNYTSVSDLQTFAPTNLSPTSDGPVPLEVLIDLRCESHAFERLVPQTEATFHYDKFNRLRLRNNVTSIATKSSSQNSTVANNSHLQDQTDVIHVHIPRFTVSANAEHFQAISNIVTKLLLFSDPAHKTRLDKLETLVFAYDFTDLGSAASVVSNLQSRLRDALETERQSMKNPHRLEDEDARLSLLQLRAHMFLLAEELNLLFDAIKMAQDRSAHHTDQNSALLLHASSSEISWRMLDERRNLLSKLVVTNINFHWLSRQDSSTVNHLTIGNLTAFDGSRYALWAEILSKYDEPANHPLLKRGLFLLANWTVLAPVGGITIYEAFELSLHPLRLQVDAKVGRRIMEYVWPDRKDRQAALDDSTAKEKSLKTPLEIEIKSPTSSRSSIDSPRALHRPVESNGKDLTPPLRKLGSSRSFTDLRLAKDTGVLSPGALLSPPSFLQRTYSSDSITFASMSDTPETQRLVSLDSDASDPKRIGSKDAGDAQVMKTRSSQKSFVLVRISSLHLLLSVVKEGSFECHDARIKTRELEYRNQTWSFEELVNQFIPSNMSWRGWVKMALNQPLVPVLPVARELLSKTKWTASKTGNQPHDHPLRLLHPSILATDDDSRLDWIHGGTLKTIEGSSKNARRNPLKTKKVSPVFTETPLTAEPETMHFEPQSSDPHPTSSRRRVKSLFSKSSRHSSKGRKFDKQQSEDINPGNSSN